MPTLVQGDGRSTTPPVKRDADWWVETVDRLDQLETWRPAWDDLARHAVEPNVFYESWMLLEAWRLLGAGTRWTVVLILRSGARPQDPPELCGLVPLIQKTYEKLPVDSWSLWENEYVCNTTPLLRSGVAGEAWQAFCEWLAGQTPLLLELPLVTADGPFHHAWQEVVNERNTPVFVDRQYARALLRPASSAEAYCAQTMSCHNRQELRRQRRRLGEAGLLEARVFQPGDEIAPWTEEFLRLESLGWKGEEGTAFASAAEDANYLRAIALAGAERNQVVMLGLFLNGEAIALKLNFLSGNGGFTFKIAFDERFKKYSPGVQLELENIDWFHRQTQVEWLDSCAKPKHFMIGRLWRDRRLMQRAVMSSGSRWGDLLVGTLALGKAVKAALRPRPQPKKSLQVAPITSGHEPRRLEVAATGS